MTGLVDVFMEHYPISPVGTIIKPAQYKAVQQEIISLREQLEKANERVTELKKNNTSCAVAIREIIAKGDIGPLLITGDELDKIVNKFAIETEIKGLKDYQALCGFADCRKSIDARIKQLEEQLRKGGE